MSHETFTPAKGGSAEAELDALKNTFANYQNMIIANTKGFTGHTMGAASAIEAIACCMVVKENIMPPTINYVQKDEECDLDYVANKSRRARLDNILLSCFGPSGTNNAVILSKWKN